MTDYIYPSNTVETGQAPLTVLGGFWTTVFDDGTFTESYCKSTGKLFMQSHNDVQEYSDAAGNSTIPVYHTTLWKRLTVKDSEKETGLFLAFGDDAVFGYQPVTGQTYKFGAPINESVSYPLPAEIKDVTYIADSIIAPKVVYVKNVDFLLKDDRVYFRENPITNTLLSTRTILNSISAQADKELDLFLFHSKSDVDWIWKQFGYVVGVRYSSSQNYKNLNTAVFNSITGGSSKEQIQKYFSAATDIRLVEENNETVEYIGDAHNYKLIITDKNVYKFHERATPIVSIGSIVNAGDSLVDSLRFYELKNGTASADLTSMTVPKSFFQLPLSGDLTFVNYDQPTTVTFESGYTKITFPINGEPSDAQLFWDTVHAKGIASGQTLAHLLDQREIKIGEPTTSALPAVINPFQFMAANVFRNNLFVVTAKRAHFGVNAIGVDAISHLKKIIPPHTMLLGQIDYSTTSGIPWFLDFSNRNYTGYVGLF